MSLLPIRKRKRLNLDHVERVLERLIERHEPVTNETLKHELLQIVRDYRAQNPPPTTEAPNE